MSWRRHCQRCGRSSDADVRRSRLAAEPGCQGTVCTTLRHPVIPSTGARRCLGFSLEAEVVLGGSMPRCRGHGQVSSATEASRSAKVRWRLTESAICALEASSAPPARHAVGVDAIMKHRQKGRFICRQWAFSRTPGCSVAGESVEPVDRSSWGTTGQLIRGADGGDSSAIAGSCLRPAFQCDVDLLHPRDLLAPLLLASRVPHRHCQPSRRHRHQRRRCDCRRLVTARLRVPLTPRRGGADTPDALLSLSGCAAFAQRR
jgi:hypothetical protein